MAKRLPAAAWGSTTRPRIQQYSQVCPHFVPGAIGAKSPRAATSGVNWSMVMNDSTSIGPSGRYRSFFSVSSQCLSLCCHSECMYFNATPPFISYSAFHIQPSRRLIAAKRFTFTLLLRSGVSTPLISCITSVSWV